MKDFFSNSVYIGVVLSVLSYIIGVTLKKKFKIGIFNPLLIAIILVITILLLIDVDYETYYEGAKYISYLLTPATVCLAIPVYEQFELLKDNVKAVVIAICAGVLSSLGSVLALAYLFNLNHEYYVTLLPKSITTAMGIGISEELGGITAITVAVIILTGVIGNILAETICKLFKIHDPIAVGLAIGTSSHAIGTSKALEIGQIQGAMSSLSIAVSGIITVVGASIFANFL